MCMYVYTCIYLLHISSNNTCFYRIFIYNNLNIIIISVISSDISRYDIMITHEIVKRWIVCKRERERNNIRAFQRNHRKERNFPLPAFTVNVEYISGNDCSGCQNSRPGKLNSPLSFPSMNFVIIKQWT